MSDPTPVDESIATLESNTPPEEKKGAPFQPSTVRQTPQNALGVSGTNDYDLTAQLSSLIPALLNALTVLRFGIRNNPSLFLPPDDGGKAAVLEEELDGQVRPALDKVTQDVQDLRKLTTDENAALQATFNKQIGAVSKDINDLDAGIRHIEIDVIPTKIQAKTDAGEKVAKGESVTAEEGKQAADIAATKDIADKAVKTVNAAKEQIDETDKQAKKTASDVNTALSQVNTAYDNFVASLKAFDAAYPKIEPAVLTLATLSKDMKTLRGDLSDLEGGIAQARLSLDALKIILAGTGG